MAIGEAGSITTNSPAENTPITVDFDEPLTDPVIALTATNDGGNQFVLRVTDITTDANGDAVSFTFIIEEWEYHDGAHPATETINWLAVEEGVHTLPDGRVIEAGTTSATDANSSVSFAGSYASPPVVLTSVMSENDTTTVDSDPFNITATGFTVSLQEEEAEDGAHAAETVGFIAIEPGAGTVTHGTLNHQTDIIGLGGTFTDPITVAETQTMNGGDPATVIIDGGNGTSTIGLAIDEEQSNDSETNHINETVGVVTFENGLIPCFTAGARVATPYGKRRIETLGPGDLVLTRDGGPQPVLWRAETTLPGARLAAEPELCPVIIPAGAFGPGLPRRDMAVSPQHRLLVTGWKAQLLTGEDEVLAPAVALVGVNGITQARPQGAPVGYHHLLLGAHHVVQTDGVWSESLYAGQLDKSELDAAARAALFARLPDLAVFGRDFGPTARRTLRQFEARALVA